MPYDELQIVISNLEDGPEKDWVTAYAPSTMTQLDYTKAVQKMKGELGFAIALQDEYQQLTKRLRVIEPRSEEAKRLIARKSEIYYQFGDLDDLIENLRMNLWLMERKEKYTFLHENEDYAELSKKNPPFLDWTYVAVNNPVKARRWENFVSTTGVAGIAQIYDTLNYNNLHYMNDKERANFNYLYAKEGKDAAEEYLDYLQYELNERSISFWKEKVSNIIQAVPGVSQVAASVLRTPMTLLGGTGLADVFRQKIRNVITGEDKPIDYNRDAMLFSQVSDTISKTVAQNIIDAVEGVDEEKYPLLSQVLSGEILAALYQLGMDVQDSAAVAALTAVHPALGAGASVLSSASVGTQAMLDAEQNGATDEQTLIESILSILYDILLEETKFGSWLKYGSSFVKDINE